MDRPPRDARESLFTREFSFRLLWQGVMVGGLTLTAYLLGHLLALPGMGADTANTMAFATLTMCQLFHAFDVRSERHCLTQIGLFSNPAMNKAFLVGMGMQLAVLCLPPFRKLFSVTAMTGSQWVAVLALSVAPLLVCELEKRLRR